MPKRIFAVLMTFSIACFLAGNVYAEELNEAVLAKEGKEIHRLDSSRKIQLFRVAPKEIPNASIGATHGPLYIKLAGTFKKVAPDVVQTRIAPDGRTFFMDNNNRLFALTDNGEVKTIADGVYSDFSFNKKGTRILVSRPVQDEIYTAIDLLDINGQTVRRIVETGNHSFPMFTPDEQKILYASGDSGIVSWYVVNQDGTDNHQITNIGMEPGNMTDDFVPIMGTWQNAGFIDNTHFRYMSEDEIWTLDITTGKAVKMAVR